MVAGGACLTFQSGAGQGVRHGKGAAWCAGVLKVRRQLLAELV